MTTQRQDGHGSQWDAEFTDAEWNAEQERHGFKAAKPNTVPAYTPDYTAPDDYDYAYTGGYKANTYKSGGYDGGVRAQSNYAATRNNYGTTYKAKTCTHFGKQPLFMIGERSFAGASERDMNEACCDVNLRCNGTRAPTQAKHIVATSRYAALEAYSRPTEFVSLDWPDMGVPPILPGFWKAFVEALPERCHVVVNCHGGHGRTGTALACIYMIYAKVTAWQAIEYIRSSHCHHAIETCEQEDYIIEVARFHGLEVGEEKLIPPVVPTAPKQHMTQHELNAAKADKEGALRAEAIKSSKQHRNNKRNNKRKNRKHTKPEGGHIVAASATTVWAKPDKRVK